MPAKSKAQQRFMGMVHSAQKGENPASAQVAKAAKSIKKKDAKDISMAVSTGMQIFTKTLGNASAAMLVSQGDQVKNQLDSERGQNLSEQATAESDELRSLINRAQRNAASYLIGNKVSKQDVQDILPDVPQTSAGPDPIKLPESKIRTEIRKRIKKIINGKK